MERYESASVERFSTFALRDDFFDAEEWKQYRIENTNGTRLEALADDCRAHGTMLIRLSCRN